MRFLLRAMIGGSGAGWSKRFILQVWYPVGTLIFFGGGTLSALNLGGQFDWRYSPLSTLSSAVSNPHGFAYCCLGLIVSFSMALPVCGYLRSRCAPLAPKTARFAFRALATGCVGAIAVGCERLLTQSISLNTHKLHEVLSIVTFFGLLLGVPGFWLCLIRWLVRHRGWPVWAVAVVLFLSAGPMIGTGLSQGYLYLFGADLGWVGPRWAELGVPLYLSFAFWEWLSAAGVFVYFFLIVALLPGEIPSSLKRSDNAYPEGDALLAGRGPRLPAATSSCDAVPVSVRSRVP